MKIGVLSDTHDNSANLLFVLGVFREKGIRTLIHCGDLTGFDMVHHFKDFRLIYAIGNMDVTTGAIKKHIEAMGEENYAGLVYRGSLDGMPIAVTHSHINGKVMELIREKRFKWIFHGHTHKKRDEIVRGVRIVNPGALGGLGKEPRSFCIVDLQADDVEFIRIP